MNKVKLFFTLILILGTPYLSFAQETKRTATISEIEGVVEARIAKARWTPAQVGMVLNQGDVLRTKGNSLAVLDIDGEAKSASVEVKENSEVMLATLLEDKGAATKTTLLNLSLGKLLINAKELDSEKSKFEVKTPTSIIAVRGTNFSVSVESLE